MARHSLAEAKPSSTTDTDERPKRLARAGRVLRDLVTREAVTADVIDRLPYRIFENHDSAYELPVVTTLESAERSPRAARLSDYRPLADVAQTYHALGLSDTAVMGVIKGDYARTPYADPAYEQKDAALAAKNTVYILKTHEPGQLSVCTLIGEDALQNVRQLHAAGKRANLKELGAIQMTHGSREQIGRGEANWWPYKTHTTITPDAPEARISKIQATIDVDLAGNIVVTDGNSDSRSHSPSKNGTKLVHGNETEMPMALDPYNAEADPAMATYSEWAAQMPAADPWAAAEQAQQAAYTEFTPTDAWLNADLSHNPYADTQVH
jgi:hypothetical protein